MQKPVGDGNSCLSGKLYDFCRRPELATLRTQRGGPCRAETAAYPGSCTASSEDLDWQTLRTRGAVSGRSAVAVRGTPRRGCGPKDELKNVALCQPVEPSVAGRGPKTNRGAVVVRGSPRRGCGPKDELKNVAPCQAVAPCLSGRGPRVDLNNLRAVLNSLRAGKIMTARSCFKRLSAEKSKNGKKSSHWQFP